MDTCSDFRPAAIAVILLAFFFTGLTSLTAYGAEEDTAALDRAQTLLREQRAGDALDAFKILIARGPAFSACVGAARASAVLERPEEALRYYREALQLAADREMERLSLFGIARMNMWLGSYAEAEHIYEQLLSQPLSDEDRAVAAAGLARSLSFQDKPMRAYRTMQTAGRLTPLERMELARAALWAGWQDRAAAILDQDIPLEPNTWVARELELLRRDVRTETVNPVSARGEFISDSDGLRIRKSEFSAGKTFSGTGMLGLAYQHQGFDQQDQELAMNGIQARYTSRFDDAVWLFLQAGPIKYGDWRTGVWSGSAVYRPNDEMRYEAFVGREAVETFDALARHIRTDTAGLNASYAPFTRLLLAAGVYRQTFSDDNDRLGGTARIATPVSARIGLNAQIRAKYFEDSRTGMTGYFNPERFHEEKLLLELDNRLGPGWRLYALAGPGIQNTSPGDGSETTVLAEASLQGRILNIFTMSLDYGYSDSAASSSSGYRRQYSGITFSTQW